MTCDRDLERYLQKHPLTAAIDAARATGCTEAEALTAQSEQVIRLPRTAVVPVIEAVLLWERVFVLIRNRDAVAELTIPARKLSLNERGWLNYLEQEANLHIRISAATEVLGLVRQGRTGLTFSFNFVNEGGEVFCRLYARSAEDIAAFKAFWQKNAGA